MRQSLQGGRNRLTLVLQSTVESAPLKFVPVDAVDSGTRVRVTTAETPGVLGDLYDAEGHLVAQDQSLIDFRRLEAGTYFLRAHNPFADRTNAPFDFSDGSKHRTV